MLSHVPGSSPKLEYAAKMMALGDGIRVQAFHMLLASLKCDWTVSQSSERQESLGLHDERSESGLKDE